MPYRLNGTIEKTLISWIEQTSGLPTGRVIWDRQDVYGSANAVKPDKPYFVLNINKIKTPHRADRSYFTLDTWNVGLIKAFNLQIRIISLSDGYLELIDKVRSGLELVEIRQMFWRNDMAWWNCSDIQDVEMLYSTQHVYNAYFEAEFAFSVNQEEATGQIDSVRIDYDYNDGDYTGTIIVPP